jgi:hypothetical protein
MIQSERILGGIAPQGLPARVEKPIPVEGVPGIRRMSEVAIITGENALVWRIKVKHLRGNAGTQEKCSVIRI